MMELLSQNSIFADINAKSKKQLLEGLSKLASENTDIDQDKIYDVLSAREDLGTTGIGKGIAIPHGKFPELQKISGLFIRLKNPIDFDSVDEKPVDLIFTLLAPEGAGADHLRALAQVSRTLRNPECREKLRAAKDPKDLREILAESES